MNDYEENQNSQTEETTEETTENTEVGGNSEEAEHQAEQSENTQQNEVASPEKPEETEQQAEQTTTNATAHETEQSKFIRNAEIEKARQEARVQAIVDAVGTNPFTDKPIKNAADVEEYLLMRKIEQEGKDPIRDYPEYVKQQKAKEVSDAEKARIDRETALKSINEFRSEFPSVDLQKLAKDTDFDDFAKGALGTESLASIYKRYIAFKERIESNAKKQAQQRAVAEKAKQNASVGSLSNENGSQESDYFTLEQIKAMSPEEVHAKWEKVQRSMKRINQNLK